MLKQTSPKTLYIFFMFQLMTVYHGLGQKKVAITRSDAPIMEAAIEHDLKIELEYGITPPKTIVLDRSVAKKSLDVLDLGAHPDSILKYSFYHGTNRLIELIRRDSSWIKLIHLFNQRSGEISRIKKGDLAFKDFDIKLITNRSIQNRFKRENGWESFYRTFSSANGLYRVSSPVVYKNKAMLYLSHSKGPLNGVGYIIFLEEKTRWEVSHRIELWVS